MESRVVDAEVVRPFFEAHPHPNVLEPLHHPERKRFIAVFDGDHLVATATLERKPLGIDQLGGVLVAPHLRGQGIGHALMEAICAEAKRTNARWIVCGVYRREPDVSPYYRRHGFRTIAGYIPGTSSPAPLGWLARGLATMARTASGPDAIRIMGRRP